MTSTTTALSSVNLPLLSDGAPLTVSFTPYGMLFIDTLLAPLRAWVSPRFHGLENIPADGPVMLVGNHSLVAIDVSLLHQELLHRRGRVLRGMGDDALMSSTPIRKMIQWQGSVRGSRENCRTLLEHGEMVLVLPGGTREAFRSKARKYALRWEGRTGFAQVAIEAGVPIVPVAMVGSNDAYDIVVDGDHAVMGPLRRLGERGPRANPAPPLFHGIGPTFVPKPQRFYYSVGAPIDAAQWSGPGDRSAELQSVVHAALETELDFLLTEQARDRGRTLRGRIRGGLNRNRSRMSSL